MDRNFTFRGWAEHLNPKLVCEPQYNQTFIEYTSPSIFKDTWVGHTDRRAYWNLPYVDIKFFYEVQSTCSGCWALRGVYPKRELKQALMDVIDYSKVFPKGFFRVIDVTNDGGWGYINAECWPIRGIV